MSLFKTSKKEIYLFHNHLVGMVKNVEGHYTTVDLQNESCVTGKIIYVDGYMNIDMEDAVFHNARGKQYNFPNFYIQARSIRYVHIPENIEMTDISKTMDQFKNKKQQPVRTFKQIRALRNQAETVSEIGECSKQTPTL